MLSSLGGCSSDRAEATPDAMAYDAQWLPDQWLPVGQDADRDVSTPTAEVGDSPSSAAEVKDSGPFEVALADLRSATTTVSRIVDPQVPTADATTLAADNAAFAFDVYQQLAQQLALKGKNLVFSPASLSIALAMTYAGAAGTTATQMAQTLHFSLPSAQLHPAFNALDQALASRGQGKLGADGGPMRVRIVNALWAEQTASFQSVFLDTLAANYGASMNLLDFIGEPEVSRTVINEWVSEQTANKIPELLAKDTIDSNVKLVLTDAVYLNAAWAVPFYPGMTSDGAFSRLDNSSATTKLMSADSISLPAVQGSNYRAVSLAYADTRLSLVVVLPDTGQFEQVERTMNASTLDALVGGMTQKKVGLTLPRFRVETGSRLRTLLQALGMTAAFDPSAADFSGMTGAPGLYISDVIHKAFIDVAEKGTEAAAATAVIMKDASIPQVDLYFRADHPFLYYLRDQPTGAILFMGRVLDPTTN